MDPFHYFRLKVSIPNFEAAQIDITTAYNGNRVWIQERSTPNRAQWFPVSSGRWGWKQLSATKFRQFGFALCLQNDKGKWVANLPDPTYRKPPGYKLNDSFDIEVVRRDQLGSFYPMNNHLAKVTVLKTPGLKKFKIRLVDEASISVGPVAADRCWFQVLDVASNQTATYAYTGEGGSLPIPKAPSIPSVTIGGDWNDFDAPAWMSPEDFCGYAEFKGASVGLGSSTSKMTLSFAKFFADHPEFGGGAGPALCITNFSTGRTIGLPSITLTRGRFSIWSKAAPYQKAKAAA